MHDALGLTNKYHLQQHIPMQSIIFICSSHLWFTANPNEKTWTEPEELVATTISGSCVDGPNAKENIADGYVPLRKLYDCSRKIESHKYSKRHKFFRDSNTILLLRINVMTHKNERKNIRNGWTRIMDNVCDYMALHKVLTSHLMGPLTDPWNWLVKPTPESRLNNK